WSVYHVTRHSCEQSLIVLLCWVWQFSAHDIVYILGCEQLVSIAEDDEYVCVWQTAFLKLNSVNICVYFTKHSVVSYV
ncbi:hypothetical protein PSY31_23125, partial [Shigella flexneri]|nr:hypothetical protein [Shigella flexneri]